MSSDAHTRADGPVGSQPLGSNDTLTAVAGSIAPKPRRPAWLELPESVQPRRFRWHYALTILGFHLLLPLACLPWLFSWTGLILVPLGNYVFGSLGINLAYHRLLTHRSLRCPRRLEHALAILGICSLQDSPARWVTTHRAHHQHSDEQPDPHSPWVDFFWGHVGWLLVRNCELDTLDKMEKYARDVLQDPFYLKIERFGLALWIYLAHAVLFPLVGFVVGWATTATLIGGVQFSLSMLVWGVIARTVYVWHITWAVNSVSHRWGYRNYGTSERSKNNWVVALLTNGEGWHNNHHADPRSAAHGHRWWEIDLTYLTILGMKRLGLATDVIPIRCRESLVLPSAISSDKPGRDEKPKQDRRAA